MQTLSAFPTRPLRVHAPRPKTVRRILTILLAEIILIALLAGAVWWMGPSLLNDARIRQNPAVAEAGTVTDGECKTKLAITFCDATLAAPAADGATVSAKVSYLFVDLHFGDYDTDVVQSAEDPRLLTTSLGLDYFWNRVASFAAAVVLLLAGIVGLVRTGFRQQRTEREAVALDGQRLKPMVVTIRGGQKVKRTITWRLAYPAPTGGETKVAVMTGSDFMPFTLDAQGKRALAVTGPAGGTPFLIDSTLARLELTEAERTALLQAQQRDQAAG